MNFKKGSSSIILVVVIVFLVLAIFGLLYYFLVFKGKGNEVKTNQDVTKQTEQNQEITPIDPDSFDYKTFITTDGNFSIKYPSAWIKSEVGDATSLVGVDLVNKYKLEIPFTASLNSQDKIASLTLVKMEIDENMTADDLIDDLMKENKNKGMESEIKNKTTSDDGKVTDFDVEYTQTQNNTKLKGKEKMFVVAPIGNTKAVAYVSFVTLQKDWEEYKNVGDYLLDSISLVGITDR